MSESTGSPWTLIFALPAAVAAAVAAVNGLSQLTRSAKARRTIEWINSTIDKDADGDSRQHPLTELRTEQEALRPLVASTASPGLGDCLRNTLYARHKEGHVRKGYD